MRTIILTIFVLMQSSCAAHHIRPSEAARGDDAMYCGIYLNSPNNAQEFQFANDSSVRGDDENSDLHIGINGVHYDLYSENGANLMAGGRYFSKNPAGIKLDVSIDRYLKVHFEDSEEIGYSEAAATITLNRGRETYKSTSVIRCDGFDTEYFKRHYKSNL